MIVGVPRETFPGERRVALVPSVVPTLAKSGLEVIVQAGAGIEAGYPDADYAAKGAKLSRSAPRCFAAPTLLCRCWPRIERQNRQSRPAAFSSRPSVDRIFASARRICKPSRRLRRRA